jgi:hypothetical protein
MKISITTTSTSAQVKVDGTVSVYPLNALTYVQSAGNISLLLDLKQVAACEITGYEVNGDALTLANYVTLLDPIFAAAGTGGGGGGGITAVHWGDIAGVIADQEDLQEELDAKASQASVDAQTAEIINLLTEIVG